jgi:Beta-ketoacyl synthase, N-terminal domain
VNFRATSVITGWGEGLQSLPANATTAAAGRQMLPLATPQFADDRLRRATRECTLAITAVERALLHGSLSAAELAGQRTALVYASASSYVAANWAFLHADTSSVMYFPYTAPSAVPGEVSMYFNITGPYLSFLSGANAGLEALWQAVTLLNTDQCDRALILTVETFVECAELYTRGRRLFSWPLVETAVCVLLERPPSLATIDYNTGQAMTDSQVNEQLIRHVDELLVTGRTTREATAITVSSPTVRNGEQMAHQLRKHWPSALAPSLSVANVRTGTCLAATPLIGLLIALAEAQREQILCLSRWGQVWSLLRWPSRLSPETRA